MFQTGGIAPMQGQANVLFRYRAVSAPRPLACRDRIAASGGSRHGGSGPAAAK